MYFSSAISIQSLDTYGKIQPEIYLLCIVVERYICDALHIWYLCKI